MDDNLPRLSVILPTYNPKAVPLQRTLDSLRAQSLAKREWELLLIDNKSDTPLEQTQDVSWHPNGRIIREEELGLTPARLCGIRNAQAQQLVFVDDDNVLREDYLENALGIFQEREDIGVFGGQVVPEFAVEPGEWTQRYWFMLALRECKEERVAFDRSDNHALPCGAGMCVRKRVVEAYAQSASENPLRGFLDRRGNSLASSGDTDIAFTATDIGLGIGLFPQLELTHLIPAGRLEKDYLVRLWGDMNFSHELMNYVRTGRVRDDKQDLRGWLRQTIKPLLAGGIEPRMSRAAIEGKQRARELIEKYEKEARQA